jgi:hypothetical protein
MITASAARSHTPFTSTITMNATHSAREILRTIGTKL